MTEVTRVPLKPVAPGSLTKLWVGVIVAILIGAGLAWFANGGFARGLEVTTIAEGEGDPIQVGDVAFVKYKGSLASDGEVFDESRPTQLPIEGIFPEEGSPFPVEEGATIPGFFQGMQQMKKGGKYELYIPADLAYGAEPPPGAPIPPNADLIFEMEIVEVMSEETFQRNIGLLQQAIQGMPGGPGAPPGAGPPPGPPVGGQ